VTTALAFAHTAGPHDARCIMIGEAWGEQEDQYGVPFAGASGREFARMLIESGWDIDDLLAHAVEQLSTRDFLAAREEWLQRASVLLTNVFALRPTNNNLAYLCTARSDLPTSYALPPIRSENPRYVKEDYLPHLQRLRTEVEHDPRNLAIALGGTACWSLVGSHAIGRLRGAISTARGGPSALTGIKVLSTYHPAAIFRAWQWRVIVLADLIKAKREAAFAEVRRPAREVLVNPSIEDVEWWTQHTLLTWENEPERFAFLAPDIETMNGQIRCIGFARSRSESLVIPFIKDLRGASYWENEDDELRAWYAVRALLDSPLPKIFQNGVFDLQYLIRAGLRIRNAMHDTMLLHHALYPELQKGLGFLGSVYTNEPAWKTMRLRKGEEELKRDE
jgi:uracil-DNA glycosylase